MPREVERLRGAGAADRARPGELAASARCRLVSGEVFARDCRTGLLPQVVQPGPGTGLARGGRRQPASAAAARRASASTAAARTRAVFTGRPATAPTIARRSFRALRRGRLHSVTWRRLTSTVEEYLEKLFWMNEAGIDADAGQPGPRGRRLAAHGARDGAAPRRRRPRRARRPQAPRVHATSRRAARRRASSRATG